MSCNVIRHSSMKGSYKGIYALSRQMSKGPVLWDWSFFVVIAPPLVGMYNECRNIGIMSRQESMYDFDDDTNSGPPGRFRTYRATRPQWWDYSCSAGCAGSL